MADDILSLLARLTDYAEHSESALAKVTADVEKLRDDRYKPYITSVGAFFALFVTAVGYVYAMEQRLTETYFTIQTSIHEVRSYARINEDRIQVLDARLHARTETMAHRWDAHKQVHTRMDARSTLMAKEILDLVNTRKANGDK